MADFIKIEGAGLLSKLLLEAEPKLAKRAVRVSLKLGSKMILSAIKANAPVDSGLLKKSLGIVVGKRRKNSYAYHIAHRAKFTSQLAKASKAGKRSYYPSAVEYGHAGPGGSPRRTPAHSYFNVAVTATKKTAMDAVRDDLYRGVMELARK